MLPSLTNFFTCPKKQTRAATQSPLATASKQVRSYAAEAKAAPTEVSSILEQRIRGVQEEAGLAETGRVLSVGYGNTIPLIRAQMNGEHAGYYKQWFSQAYWIDG